MLAKIFQAIFETRATQPMVSLEISQPPQSTDEQEKIYELRRQATRHKTDKNYAEALSCICESINLTKNMGYEVTADEYLRLANYLQMAGHSDEGWSLLNQLLLDNPANIYALGKIYDRMRIFLQKEGKNNLAVRFGIIAYLYKIKLQYHFIDSSLKKIESIKGQNIGFSKAQIKEFVELEKSFASGSRERINNFQSAEALDSICSSLLKKAKRIDLFDKLKVILSNAASKLPSSDFKQLSVEVDELFKSK